jgi:Ca2+-binding RTX toxin-like protein
MASMRSTLTLLAACAAALLGPAAAANAGTLSYEGDTLVYRADPGARDSPSLDKGDQGELTFYEDNLTLAPGCTQDDPSFAAHCPMPAKIRLELGDADDSNGFGSSFPQNVHVDISGGDGKDNLQTYGSSGTLLDGGAGNDTLKGWDTDETLLGGPGDDEINGSGGADHIEGGDGNDSISPDTCHDPANDYVDGGPGMDVVDDWVIPSNDYNPPISVSMDGAANDGRPGEADNARRDRALRERLQGLRLARGQQEGRRLGQEDAAQGGRREADAQGEQEVAEGLQEAQEDVGHAEGDRRGRRRQGLFVEDAGAEEVATPWCDRGGW